MTDPDAPFLSGPLSTADLPATPLRSHRIAATAWTGAPDELLRLGDDLGVGAEYRRRIGRFLLWRAGPPVGEARYMAIDPESGETWRFDLHGHRGTGVGPDGNHHTRFRTWKEALLGREPR